MLMVYRLYTWVVLIILPFNATKLVVLIELILKLASLESKLWNAEQKFLTEKSL